MRSVPEPSPALFGFIGRSGAGNTTLILDIIAALRSPGYVVSAIKRAHDVLDLNRPGKDSWRMREAGCREVMVVGDRRFALLHEYRDDAEPVPLELARRLDGADIVLFEGFRSAPILMIEVYRPSLGRPMLEPRELKLGARGDGFVEALSGVKQGEQVVTRANFLIDAERNLKASLGSFTAGANTNAGAGKSVVHSAQGRIDEVDAKTGVLTISHDPVASLNWPKMTMEFVAANDAIAKSARPGAPIRFEFVERKPGEWVVTKIEPAGGPARTAPAKTEAHKH